MPCFIFTGILYLRCHVIYPQAFGIHLHSEDDAHAHHEGIVVEPFVWYALATVAGIVFLDSLVLHVSGFLPSTNLGGNNPMLVINDY